jgi:cyclophilin family peptidyl-prolyl cis-trans isomerase
MNTSRWLTALIIIILVLACIQWFMNSSSDAYFNQYGVTATSTGSVQASPIPSVDTTVGTKAQGAAAANASASTAQSADSNVAQANNSTVNNLATKNFMHTITIETNKGTIVFETYDADAPNTVKNFVTLAEKGFYNNLIFHRVIRDFMIQGGDPTGTGRGGPGYQFADELNSATPSFKAGYVRGTVAMANSGPDTNGSQFFIMHKDTPLPHSYTIFGRVTSGLDIVDAIANTQITAGDKPVTDVVMK